MHRCSDGATAAYTFRPLSQPPGFPWKRGHSDLTDLALVPLLVSCHVTAGAQALSRWSPRRAAWPEEVTTLTGPSTGGWWAAKERVASSGCLAGRQGLLVLDR